MIYRTHTKRPSDQKQMPNLGVDEAGFFRAKGCEKSVNGHRPGNTYNVLMDDCMALVEYDCHCENRFPVC